MAISNKKCMVVICIFVIYLTLGTCSNFWTWKCETGRCAKSRLQENESPVSPEVCELICDKYSRIWPMPRGNFEIVREVVPIALENTYDGSGTTSKDLNRIWARFLNILATYNDNNENAGHQLQNTKIYFNITNIELSQLKLDTDESYILRIFENNEKTIQITIEAATIYGARNALETLSQIIVYDEYSRMHLVPKQILVEDSPIYPVRGLLIDTARNFIKVKTIKRIIEGLAVNKLNTLHWHITDTQSFPFESTSLPELSQLGAYSPRSIYSVKDIKDIIDFASIRGVRIIPEFDGPAHVGEGWQDTGLVVCFNKEPWSKYCKEPPCGLFDPTKDELYSTLKKLYKDVINVFDPEVIHFGGDEVMFPCWRSVDSIQDWMRDHNMSTLFDSGYVDLWKYYQDNVYQLFMNERKRTIPAILWTSTLTDKEHLDKLSNEEYIIHVWTEKTDKTISNLLKNDFRVIISNYDYMYLDCGFQSWTSGSGNNWCAPYKTWKEIYANSPIQIVSKFAEVRDKTHLIMGAMTALWTETIDDSSAENKIWPRTAAVAERAWAEPTTQWMDAEYRLDSHRKRMMKLGISSDTLVPEWCYLNQGYCI